jgi:hypothetical protein
MSGNSSATGGYLRQLNTPLSDDALLDAIHDAIAGITGIAPELVRPRWQHLPPNQPPNTPPAATNWCAFGITDRTPINYPVIRHFAGGPDRVTRWSAVTVLASLYGPACHALAEQLRDGFYVDQNREQLGLVGVKLTEVGELTAVPDQVNLQWLNHVDIPIILAQSVDRDYDVLDIASSQGTITTENGVTVDWNVNE